MKDLSSCENYQETSHSGDANTNYRCHPEASEVCDPIRAAVERSESRDLSSCESSESNVRPPFHRQFACHLERAKRCSSRREISPRVRISCSRLRHQRHHSQFFPARQDHLPDRTHRRATPRRFHRDRDLVANLHLITRPSHPDRRPGLGPSTAQCSSLPLLFFASK